MEKFRKIYPPRFASNDVYFSLKEFNFFETPEDWRRAFEKFKEENGHYPNSLEIDKTKYLPSSRTIQRIFDGGLKELRELIGLDKNDHDLRTGFRRSSLISQLSKDSLISEDELYFLLSSKFGPEKVHRQEPYTDKIKNLARSDMGIYLNGRHFYIDIFIPKDEVSLIGCIDSKLRKFKKYDIQPDVYLVIGNKTMDNYWISYLEQYKTQRKLQKLPSHVKVVTYEKLMSLINNNFVV